jgi:hypothetical protein
VGSVLVHGATLDYGFSYDDYFLARPHTWSQMKAAFFGHWYPDSIMAPFYRPLTVAFHAARFELFQFDPWWYHALSLVLFGLGAALTASFLRGCTQSAAAAVVGLTWFLVHPGFIYSAVAWTTNHMHLLQMLIVLIGLGWWWFCRARSAAWWVPLLLLQACAFGIKEDGIVLLPFLLATHLAYKGLVDRRVPWPPLGVLIATPLLLAGLVWLRQEALGGLGGYSRPSWAQIRANLSAGPYRTLLQQPAERPWQPFVAWTSAGLMAAGLVAALVRPRAAAGGLFLMTVGILAVAAFNIPFAFVTKAEQWHLLTLGAVLVLTGAWFALWQSAPAPLRVGLLVVTAGLAVAMAAVGRDIARDFAPYSPATLAYDRDVTGWAMVSEDVRRFLDEKRAAWDARRETLTLQGALPLVSEGLHALEEHRGERFRWTGGEVRLYVQPGRRVAVRLRTIPVPNLERQSVAVLIDGREVDRLTLEPGPWRQLELPLPRRTWRPGGRILVELRVEHPWRPSERFPGSRDPRVLGVQLAPMGVIERLDMPTSPPAAQRPGVGHR